jgi:hypothetical protein
LRKLNAAYCIISLQFVKKLSLIFIIIATILSIYTPDQCNGFTVRIHTSTPAQYLLTYGFFCVDGNLAASKWHIVQRRTFENRPEVVGCARQHETMTAEPRRLTFIDDNLDVGQLARLEQIDEQRSGESIVGRMSYRVCW